MSTNYFVLKNGNYDTPGIMLIDKIIGTIFVDRKAKAYDGYGLYKTKTSGKDKKQKPFIIVVPVFEFTDEMENIRIWLQDSILCGDDVEKNLDCANYSRRFNKRTGRDMLSKVTIDDVMAFIKDQSVEILQDVISRPLGNLDKDTFVVSYNEDADKITVPWGQDVMVVFMSGEVHMKPISWVVQNRERMIQDTIKVVGDTCETLHVVITRGK